MADLATRAEIGKLAAELDVDADDLAFLSTAAAEDVRQLRDTIGRARFRRLEPQLRRLAGTVHLLPLTLTARIARIAVGPTLSGRIASVVTTEEAIAFAQHYDAAYLARVVVTLQPDHTAAIIAAVRPELAVDVAQELLTNGDFVTLGRLVSAAPPEVVSGVIARATAAQLLLLAYYTDDHDQLDDIIRAQDDDTLTAVVHAARPDHLTEMISVITFVRPETGERLIGLVRRARLLGAYRTAAGALGVELAA